MKIYAKAKINLTLDIKERRPDGYHEVSTVYQTIGLCDLLQIEKAEGTDIVLDCSDKSLPCGDENLVVRAAKLFFAETGIKAGVHMYLEKVVPYEAGLGGGSSDAAAALVLLDRLFGTKTGEEGLEKMAARLGSDTAFFIRGGAAAATGRGEKLEALPSMPACYLAVVKPLSASSTAAAYKALDELETYSHPDSEKMAEALKAGDLEKVTGCIGNSFEDIKGIVCPEMDDIKNVLFGNGAKAAVLCGSGSAVCGIFDDKEKAERACGEIKKTRDGHRVFLTIPA